MLAPLRGARAVACALVLWAGGPAYGGVAVGPPIVLVEVPAGELAQTSLRALNGTSGSVIVSAIGLDWWVEDGRAATGVDPGRRDSALPWTVVPDDRWVLAPGGTVDIPVYFQPPEAASGGYYVAVRVESAVEAGEGSMVAAAAHVSLMFVRIAGTGTEALRLTDVSAVAPTATTPLVISGTLHGEGDVHSVLRPTALIVDAAGIARARIDGPEVRVRPGQVRPFQITWGGTLEEGTYSVIVSGVYGGGSIVDGVGTLAIPGS